MPVNKKTAPGYFNNKSNISTNPNKNFATPIFVKKSTTTSTTSTNNLPSVYGATLSSGTGLSNLSKYLPFIVVGAILLLITKKNIKV